MIIILFQVVGVRNAEEDSSSYVSLPNGDDLGGEKKVNINVIYFQIS